MCICRGMRMNTRTAFIPWWVRRRRLHHHLPALRACPAPQAGHSPPFPSASPSVGSGNFSGTTTAPKYLPTWTIRQHPFMIRVELLCQPVVLHCRPDIESMRLSPHLVPPRSNLVFICSQQNINRCHLTAVTLYLYTFQIFNPKVKLNDMFYNNNIFILLFDVITLLIFV